MQNEVLLSALFLVVLSVESRCEQGKTVTHSNYPQKSLNQHEFGSNCTSGWIPPNSKDFFSEYSCMSNSSLPCPFWSYCDEADRSCKCFNNENYIFICDNQGNRRYILNCYCLTFNEAKNATEVGMCIFNCDYAGKSLSDVDMPYSALPGNVSELNTDLCGRYNRTGTLCGQCQKGLYLRPYSYDMSCITCPSVWSHYFKYILLAYLPLTIFFLIVLMLKINVPMSQIQGYVFFCQIIASPLFARTVFLYLNGKSYEIIYKLTQFFSSLYGIWNLDFFRTLYLDICLPFSPLTIISLDFAIAVYPLLLMLLTYVMIAAHDSNFRPIRMVLKPFKEIPSLFITNWDIKTSTIDAFSTFIFLSNTKFLSVCFDLLAFIKVCDTSKDGECRLALFYDASIAYFGQQHLPYAILAIFVLFFFVLSPIIILVLFPLSIFQKCLSLHPRRWHLALHVFVDSFQGCYKDGTEPGTRDCRWFSAIPFIVRLIIFTTYAAGILSPFYVYCVIILVLTAILTINVDPFKPKFKHFHSHFVVFILFLASVMICSRGLQYSKKIIAVFYAIIILILLFHLMYISVIIFHWIVSHRKFHRKFGCEFITRYNLWKQG